MTTTAKLTIRMLSSLLIAIAILCSFMFFYSLSKSAGQDDHGISLSSSPKERCAEGNRTANENEYYSDWMSIRFVLNEDNDYAIVRYAIVDDDGDTIRRCTSNLDASGVSVELWNWAARNIDASGE